MNTRPETSHNGLSQPRGFSRHRSHRLSQSYRIPAAPRVIYCPCSSGLEERFLTWDHAQDECRTLARRLIRWCKQNDMSLADALRFVQGLPSGVVASEFKAIVLKHPAQVVNTTVAALAAHERESGSDIRHIASIRPCITRDESTAPCPYRVVGVRLIAGKP